MQIAPLLLMTFLLIIPAQQACAHERNAQNMMGAKGLSLIPEPRMDEPGTVSISLSTLDPYLHAKTTFQIAAPLSISLRQTAEISALNKPAKRLFPGIDLKLRLKEESAHTPEITLGLQSAAGHRRMAGEFLSFSKRYENFDVTAGMAWGRLGSAGHMRNPLGLLGGHFIKERSLDGENPGGPNDWFTGEEIGFFAGIDYALPAFDGLSLKAGWGADNNAIEHASGDFTPPQPWFFGASWTPAPWIDFGAAIVGGKKIAGSLTLRTNMQQSKIDTHKKSPPPQFRPYRTGLALPSQMTLAAERNDIKLYQPHIEDRTASALLLLDPSYPSPVQLGHAAIDMSNHAGEIVEEIRITPISFGLEGHEISLQRGDLEKALAQHQGSPQEIWRNISFHARPEQKNLFQDRFNGFDSHTLRLIWDSRISVSEKDAAILYRTSLIAEEKRKLSEHIWAGGALRLNLHDNLDHLHDNRPRSPLPVHSDIDDFAARTIATDRMFLSWMTTPKPDLHVAVTAGMLEETCAGIGGEVLYRPFGKTFAIGAQAYQVFKRSPYTAMNMGLNGDHLLTGHINAWYEVPDSGLTASIRIGRYLAEDFGGTISLQHEFKNGTTMEAFATATNAADIDPFGNEAHIYSGLKLRIPVGSVRHLPQNSEVRIAAAPIGRDTGQTLDPPVRLYEVSQPLSYRHMVRHWTEILD